MRVSFHLRSELFPYIYTSTQEACSQNVPLDRPLYLDLPNDEDAYHNGQEYLLGDNILVAPITSAGAGPGHVSYQTVWFPPTPAGYWYDLLTGERGAQFITSLSAADIDEFPIYVRGGVPLPMQTYTPRMGTTQITALRVRCYPGRDGQVGTAHLYEDDGVTTLYARGQCATTSLVYKRTGNVAKIFVSRAFGAYAGQPISRRYIFELPDIASPGKVTVNGRKAIYFYDPATSMVTILIAPLPVTRSITVVAYGCVPTGWDMLHAACVQRRIAESATGLNYTGPPSGLLDAALTAAQSPAEQTAVLASAGIALDHKNIATDFYPEAYQDDLFVSPGIVDFNRLTFPNGLTVNLPSHGINDIPVSTIGTQSRSVTFQINGKTYSLSPGS
jgi:hypothetical protein